MPTTAKPVSHLDDPSRISELRTRIRQKRALRMFYREVYEKYRSCIGRTPPGGLIVELGSGAGFAKDIIPEIITSDVIAYPGIDKVIDATRMPFESSSVRAICMLNVFHHLPDAQSFLMEASRCLVPGGRIFIMDQHIGRLSRFIYGYLHHEPCDPETPAWAFESTGPVSDGNGALAWIVFQRDRKLFEKLFPTLRLEFYRPHTPLRYWLLGGLKNWSILPAQSFEAATRLEKKLVEFWPGCASFVDIEVVRRG